MKKIFNVISQIINFKDPLSDYKIYCYDGDNSKYSLVELLQKLEERIISLENKVKQLEEENVENSNLIYEVMNSIDAVDRRIDIIADEFRVYKNV